MSLLKQRPRTPREWQALLGIDNQSFINLVDHFDQTYLHLRGKSLSATIEENPKGKNFLIKSYDDYVFYILFYLKSGVAFDQLAFIFQFELSGAKRNFDTGLSILKATLGNLELLPIRHFDSPDDMSEYFGENRELIIDGTEQRIQRPENVDEQKVFYSGKKKSHTRKCLIISTMDTYAHYVSSWYTGKQHDYSILKQEFSIEENWFANFTIRLDLGYIGFNKDYPNANVYLPHKNYKKNPLTENQKLYDKNLASQGIRVEHSIGGMKRYEVIADTSRLKDEELIDDILVCCAGLWNFFITR